MLAWEAFREGHGSFLGSSNVVLFWGWYRFVVRIFGI